MRYFTSKALLGGLLFSGLTFGTHQTLSAIQPHKVDPLLIEQIEMTPKSNQALSFIIEVAGLQGLSSEDFGEDRETILKSLKTLTSSTQAPLIDLLKKLQKKGQISHFKPLYLGNYIIVQGDAESIEILSENDSVTFLHQDKTWNLPELPPSEKINSEEVQSTYGLQKVNALKAWKEYGITGKGVVAGNLDTGVDAQHPDLKGKVVLFKNFTSDTGDSQGFDGHGHGTHTIGTMAGGDKSGKAIGVAPESKIVSGKIFTGSGSTQTSWILSAMEWIADPDGNPATKDAPVLVSNSWGGRQGSIDSEKPMWDLVQRWVDLNIVPVFAAGNEGPGPKTVGTPGGYPHSWAVGATNNTDGMASFSSRGPITWESKTYKKPDISAPGVDVYSAKPGGGYQNMSGTSMATPHAAGCLSLLFQAAPGLTVSQAIDMIESTSEDLGDAGWDNNYGKGRIDIHRAITKAMFGGKLSGTITDSAGNPVGGAKIHLMPGHLNFSGDMAGKFLGFVKEGDYTVTASSFGFLSQTKTVKIVKKETTEVTFSLSSSPSGLLKGTVKDNSGKPLSAKIVLLNTPLGAVETGSDGSFTLNAPHGNYKASVSSLGYKNRDLSITVPGEQSVVLESLPPILLVDDDNDSDYETFFQAALEANGKEFTLFQVGGNGPDAVTLSQYPLVIWFTGKDYQNTLTATDRDNIKKYLGAGGKLFISGQDLGYNLKGDPFLPEILGASFVKDTADNKTITGPVQGNLEGGDGANNQKYPDVIKAEGSTQVFSYGDGTGAGVKTANTLYCGFGLEGLSTASSRKGLISWVLKNMLTGEAQLDFYQSLVKRVEEIKSSASQEFSELLLAEEGLRIALKNRIMENPQFLNRVKVLSKNHPEFLSLLK